MSNFGIALTLAPVLYGAPVLFGVRIDGGRQKLLSRGLDPITTPAGHVKAGETQHG